MGSIRSAIVKKVPHNLEERMVLTVALIVIGMIVFYVVTVNALNLWLLKNKPKVQSTALWLGLVVYLAPAALLSLQSGGLWRELFDSLA